MMHVLLVLGLLGLTTSTIYAVLAVSGALRFAQRRRTAEPGEFAPPVSLIKPLHGWKKSLSSASKASSTRNTHDSKFFFARAAIGTRHYRSR